MYTRTGIDFNWKNMIEHVCSVPVPASLTPTLDSDGTHAGAYNLLKMLRLIPNQTASAPYINYHNGRLHV